MIKILSIGNSFSNNAHTYLHAIAESAGVEIKNANLYIGGCSLERHVSNIRTNAAAYGYYINGASTGRRATVMEGLLEEKWDFVTLQQASHFSGLYPTYYPYIYELSDYVKKYAPDARQIIHQTWAYEKTATHPLFYRYNSNQQVMYAALVAAYNQAAKAIGADIIRCGELVQALRRDPLFDIDNGGMQITGDGYHMSKPYGCYAVGAAWFVKLCGGDIFKANFVPEGADVYVINRIKNYVREIIG